MLKQFGEVVPGLDGKIVEWADEQAKLRRESERAAIALEREELDLAREAMRREDVRNTRGQWLGFAIIILFAAVGLYALITGRDIGGFVLLVAAMASLVTVFVVGSKRKSSASDKQDGADKP